MKFFAKIFVTVLAGLVSVSAAHAAEQPPFPPFYENKDQFDAAIAAEDSLSPYEERLSGLIVPHHMLVAPLIARGFKLASAHSYKRAILLFPDHFRQSRSIFSTSVRDYQTVAGLVETDKQAVADLLASGDLVGQSELFNTEHAIRALLPFLKHYLPGVQIVPIAVATAANREDADRLTPKLQKWVDEETIIIQSTDFSHFHPLAKARQYDQQSLNVLAARDLDQIAGLKLPDHLDSVIALYLNARLQAKVDAELHVVASQNSNEYAEGYLKETTSYITAIYGKFKESTGHPIPEDVEIIYVAGDFTLGRNVTKLARHTASASAVKAGVLDVTQGRPLFVNLEGVVLPNIPKTLRENSLAMPEDLALDWFSALNVKAVGLANNHTSDFGDLGLDLTNEALKRAGVLGLPNLQVTEFDRFAIFTATDIHSTGRRQKNLLTKEAFDGLYDYQGFKPLIAFMHWGEEYKPSATARAYGLADELRQRGVSLIIGAHPHVRSGRLISLAGGETLMIYSLGNFLFDQSSRISSGAVAEIRLFPQGTHFVRLIDVPNFYELGIEAAGN